MLTFADLKIGDILYYISKEGYIDEEKITSIYKSINFLNLYTDIGACSIYNTNAEVYTMFHNDLYYICTCIESVENTIAMIKKNNIAVENTLMIELQRIKNK